MPVSIKTPQQMAPPPPPPPPLLITTGSPLAPAYVGSTYNNTLTASGGVQPYDWSISGVAWLTVDAASGAISGMAAGTTGNLQLDVTVSDAVGDSRSAALTLPLTTAVGVTVTSNPLPAATVGTPYQAQLTATGGAGGPYTFTVTNQPVWMTLNTGGVAGALGGTPTPLTITAPATSGNLAVVQPPELSSGMEGAPYSSPFWPLVSNYVISAILSGEPNWRNVPCGFAASGFANAIRATFALFSGALPAGLSLNDTQYGSVVPAYPYQCLIGTPAAGSQGTYNFQMAATSAPTATITVTAHDLLGVASAATSITLPLTPYTTAATAYSLNILPAATPTAPWAWPGYQQSQRCLVYWWPPKEKLGIANRGTPASYNVYRAAGPGGTFPTGQPLATLLSPDGIQTYGASNQPSLFYLDTTVQPNTAYTYWVTGVNPLATPAEGPPSNPIEMVSLAGSATPPTPPAVPLDPATWLINNGAPPNPIVPTGTNPTLWLVDNVVDPAGTRPGTGNYNNRNATGTTAPGTPYSTVTHCGLQWAFDNATAGDVIVLQPSSYYRIAWASGGYIMRGPRFAGPNMTYVVCSEVPEYNPAGTLPAFQYLPVDQDFTPVALTGAAIPAGARSAQLTTAWAGRTSKFACVFLGTNSDEPWEGAAVPITPNLNECFTVLFTQGSTTITWAMQLPRASKPLLYAMMGLKHAANISDSANMAHIIGDTPGVATCLSLRPPTDATAPAKQESPTASYIHFIGIVFEPSAYKDQTPNTQAQGNLIQTGADTRGTTLLPNGWPMSLDIPLADHVYWDRCVIGSDSDLWFNPLDGSYDSLVPNGAMGVHLRGVYLAAEHFLFNQCYFCGAYDWWDQATDSQSIFVAAGGPGCIQNCYSDATGENILHGGSPVGPNSVPHNLVYRHNIFLKLTTWTRLGMWRKVKNLYEHKVGDTVALHGNLFVTMFNGTAGGAQGGVALTFSPTDQIGAGSPYGLNCPWVRVTNFDIFNNLIYNTGKMWTFIPFASNAAAFGGRLRVRNNMYLFNPGINVMAPTPGNAQAPNVSHGWQVQMNPGVVDVIYDHNTLLTNWQNRGTSNQTVANGFPAYHQTFYGTTFKSDGSTVIDRIQITNNLCDSRVWSGAGTWLNGDGALPAWNTLPTCLTNWLFSNNLVTKDTRFYARTAADVGVTGQAGNVLHDGTPHRADYAVIGFQNIGPSLGPAGNVCYPPASASDWNVIGNDPATGSPWATTDGLPIGATR